MLSKVGGRLFISKLILSLVLFCSSTLAFAQVKDPVFGHFNMCHEEIVRLPDHVYLDLKQISESNKTEDAKIQDVKSLFRKIAFDESKQNYCVVVAKVMDTEVESCQQVLQDENLSDSRIFELSQLGTSSEDVLCSLSALIGLIIRPF